MAALGKQLYFLRSHLVPTTRSFSSSSVTVSPGEGDIVLQRPGKSPLTISSIWLRDHCRAPDRYSYETHQRSVDLVTAGLGVRPAQVEADNDQLNIRWADGRKSQYDISWLLQNYQPRDQTPPKLWDHSHQDEVLEDAQVTWTDLMSSDDTGITAFLASMVKYGVCQVTGSPVCKEAGTRTCVERMFPVLQTAYDDVWEFSNEMLPGSSDSSYTDLALASHTDGTYLTQSPGLQVFHCIKVAEFGGLTVLTDGWKIADKIRGKNPDAYHLLSTLPMPSEYIHKDSDKHIHYKNTDVVFKHGPLGHILEQFRYNTYDRAPLNTVPHNMLARLYSALQYLELEMANQDNEIRFMLEPGSILFVDNWRVTHGRTAFKGHRIMSGCYVARAEWTSRARAHGVLV